MPPELLKSVGLLYSNFHLSPTCSTSEELIGNTSSRVSLILYKCYVKLIRCSHRHRKDPNHANTDQHSQRVVTEAPCGAWILRSAGPERL